jgi:transcriptional regulator with XRE-family HTH domain
MDKTLIRRNRLLLLIKQDYDGKQTNIAEHTGLEQNYFSKLLRGGSFGEKTARKIEKLCGKPEGWLEIDTRKEEPPPSSEWPFALDPILWYRLPPNQKRDIEAAFAKMVLGASVEQAAHSSKRKA